MILNISAKSLALLLAVGVVSTTGSNLRERRAALFNHSHEAASTAPKTQLRASPITSSNSAAANKQEQEESSQAGASSTPAEAEPSLAASKSIYAESEPITLTLSVGSPTHPYYSSADAPSTHVDRNYPKWSVGLFMRDADPQGGTLAPIVSINMCGAVGDACNADDRSHMSYNEVTVTFGDADNMGLMQGTWPLEVSRYGTGFDAYVLDGRGAAAIGPLEFYVQTDFDDEDVDSFHAHGNQGKQYKPKPSSASGGSGAEEAASLSSRAKSNPLLKYNKGTIKSTERQHASVALGTKANVKIMTGNGLEMTSSAIPNEDAIHKDGSSEEKESKSKGHIHSNKEEYEEDESVTIDFSIDNSIDELANYRLGIFMRMAHPQGGELEPVVSLPLCSDDGTHGKCISGSDVTTGSVTFSSDSVEDMIGSSWPMDLYEWGTGFDAYVLNESGDDVVGPVKFNIMMNDTY